MVGHEGVDNLIAMRGHPALAPRRKNAHHGEFASHGFLNGVPAGALVLVTVMKDDGAADTARPTYIEYAHGKGRIIAAASVSTIRMNRAGVR